LSVFLTKGPIFYVFLLTKGMLLSDKTHAFFL